MFSLCKDVVSIIQEKKDSFDKEQKSNKDLITSVCKQLSGYCSAATSEFNNISPIEIRKTLPAYAVSEVVASIAVSKLNYLIHLINWAINKAQRSAQQK
jgi:hypothetical protein